ncbi:hypothetical protein [Rhodopirellula sp. SWK7]|uniref:hypothetical protein n=1 Tax=Rhodopirellula sp. SWK7 TaxID=595460 RepID=UPI0002BF367D|nr:hypothetical protein [Rhodopirellula sp. SWK7]EMI45181.1 hypothetical protein RRSWK_02311 [Rhodopirellula sp. SWK7]
MVETVFQYERVMRMAHDNFANTEIRFFGNVVSGALSLADTVLVPVIGGDPIPTTIGRFTEDFTQEWCGMPFYDTVRPDSIDEPFCVCLNGGPLVGALVAPSGMLVARTVA